MIGRFFIMQFTMPNGLKFTLRVTLLAEKFQTGLVWGPEECGAVFFETHDGSPSSNKSRVFVSRFMS